MFLIREVLRCRPGKVGELSRKFQTLSSVMQRLGMMPFRLYTDVSGAPFWTLVAEVEVGAINDFLEMEGRVMGDAEAQKAMAGYHDLVESGHREIYRIVS